MFNKNELITFSRKDEAFTFYLCSQLKESKPHDFVKSYFDSLEKMSLEEKDRLTINLAQLNSDIAKNTLEYFSSGNKKPLKKILAETVIKKLVVSSNKPFPMNSMI